MQSPIEPPRDTYTYEQVVALIRDSPSIETGFGCGLSDISLSTVEDITEDVLDGTVSRSAHATIHGSASLDIARDIPFGYAVLLPWYTISDGTTKMTFNLGAYFTETVPKPLENNPVIYSVDCYDILDGLSNPLGDTYSLSAGTPILSTVEDIIVSQGFRKYIIEQSAADKTLPASKSWPFAENFTWLTVVNDLLGTVGYQGIWSDWNGALRVAPYLSPDDRSAEWTYDTDPETGMLATERVQEHDYKDAPNSWVFVRTNMPDGGQPVTGDGIYRFDNERDGPTSKEARRRTIVRKVPIEAADQASLEARARITIDADKRVPIRILTPTFPNPLHWHFDIIDLDDPYRGRPVRVQGTQWTLPLNGGNQSHQWTVLDL